LQDVPISVAVFSGDELSLRNENEISALVKISPGFTIKDGSSDNDRALYIRGVGTQSFSRGVDQSVSVVVDGAVATSTGTSLLDFSDIERVEILRGPQGMLFGKNASAGVLNVTTAKPHQDFDMALGISYGSKEEIKTHGFFNGGITEDLAARFSFYTSERDGIISNDYPGGDDYNDRKEWGARLQLDYAISDDLDVLVGLSHAERDVLCCVGGVEINTTDPTDPTDPFAFTLQTPSGKEEDHTFENDTSVADTELDTAIVTFNYQWGDHTLTSITSYAESRLESDYRSVGIGRTLLVANTSVDDIEQFTQEIRLTSPGGEAVDYQVGLYYFDKTLDGTSLQVLDVYGVGQAPVPDFIYATKLAIKDVDSKSYAAFGQATWHVTDTTRLTAGLRYNYEDIDLGIVVTNPEPPPALLFIPFTTAGEVIENRTDNAWSGRLILEHDVTDQVMVYGSIARGYKAPGANTLSAVVDTHALGLDAIIDPEIPTNFEVGLKSTWWDHRMMVNAAMFYTEFEDFHATVSTNEPGELPDFNLGNVDEMRSQGVELEMNFKASENWLLSANVAYIDAEYSSYEGAQCYNGQTEAQGCVNDSQDLSGKEASNSPDWSYNVSARYDRSITSLGVNAFAFATYYWQDEVQYSVGGNPLSKGDSFGLMDLTLGVESDDGKYQVQVFVKNLFDEFNVTSVSDLSSIVPFSKVNSLGYTYERRMGVAATYRF
jgi:iron complex outermembrane recepter protein